MQSPHSSMLISLDEYDQSIERLWEKELPPQSNQIGMTLFGDFLLETSDGVLLMRLTWFDFIEVGTVVEEVYWNLEQPAERGAQWVYPELTSALPMRPRGFIYHFVQPLGMGGPLTPSNVTLMPIVQVHQGMKKLWQQVAQ